MKKSIQLSLVSMAAMLSSACAITEVVAISGISYLVTGKSMSDNALSMVTNMDCAAHHLLSGDAVCLEKESLVLDTPYLAFAPTQEVKYEAPLMPAQFKDRPKDFYPVATAARFDSTPSATQDDDDKLNTAMYTQLRGDTSAIETSSKTVEYASADTPDSSLYAVVGSFSTEQNAETRRKLFHSFSPQISESVSGEKTLYRVVIGPLSYREEIASFHWFTDIEKTSPWVISLCADNLSEGPCRKG
ncbi:MAG: SPOR domain-containing protein [Pseudomonadota bacterium]